MQMNGQLYTPAALHPGKELADMYWIGGWVVPSAGLDTVEER
jgi:hypothetical protein